MLFILLSTLCFLNFFFFPLIYSNILREDPKAFLFPEETLTREQKVSLEEFQQKVDTNITYSNLQKLNRIIDTDKKRKYIDRPIDSIKRKLIMIDSLYLLITTNWISRPNTKSKRPDGLELMVFSEEGSLYHEFHIRPIWDGTARRHDVTLLRIIENEIDQNLTSIRNVRNEKRAIVEEMNIWTYRKFLHYSMSMLTESHIQAVSRSANFWYPIHRLTIGFFLLNAIFTVFLMVVKAQKRSANN